jgi:hypothetical protein
LNYTVMIGAVQTELQRLVSDHDRGSVDELLVVIGGPNKEGISFPGEYIFGLWLREHPPQPLTARHISRVTVHAWADGDSFDLPLRVTPDPAAPEGASASEPPPLGGQQPG